VELAYSDYIFDTETWGFRQKDLAPRAEYGPDYLEKYKAYAHTVSKRRIRLLSTVAGLSGRSESRLLDYGCGLGREVIEAARSGFIATGYDPHVSDDNPHWRGLFCLFRDEPAGPFDILTFFDSLEHLPDPRAPILKYEPSLVYVTLPECHHFYNSKWFMEWHHRKPGEHLWHWNRSTLDRFFLRLGYKPVLHSWHEDFLRKNGQCDLPNILSAIYTKIG
jgi:hypothetical protein